MLAIQQIQLEQREEINEDLHKDFEGESKTLAEGGALLYINLSQGLQ